MHNIPALCATIDSRPGIQIFRDAYCAFVSIPGYRAVAVTELPNELKRIRIALWRHLMILHGLYPRSMVAADVGCSGGDTPESSQSDDRQLMNIGLL